MKMKKIDCSETSAYKIETPGNYPKENKLYSEHVEILKSRIKLRSVENSDLCVEIVNPYPANVENRVSS